MQKYLHNGSLTVHPHQDFLLSFKCICSPFYFCYLLRKGVMKRSCLNHPGQGPASRAPTLKGALTCAVLQKEATPWQGTGRQLEVTRAYVCLLLKHGEEKVIFRSRTPAVQTVPIQPLRLIGTPAPGVSPSHSHCAERGRAVPPEPKSSGQRLRRCLPAPGKCQSSISSRSLNTEWEGRHGQMGCSTGGQRQNEELLFLSTPEMMFFIGLHSLHRFQEDY